MRTELDGYFLSPVLPHVELCLYENFIPDQGSLGSEGRKGIPLRKMAKVLMHPRQREGLEEDDIEHIVLIA